MQGTSGSVNIVGDVDTVIGEALHPVRIFAIHPISGTATIIKLHSGAVGGTINLQETGTENTGKTINYGPWGVLFPSGCTVETDANTVSCLVQYQTEV
jgi:hypothetical protein